MDIINLTWLELFALIVVYEGAKVITRLAITIVKDKIKEV